MVSPKTESTALAGLLAIAQAIETRINNEEQ